MRILYDYQAFIQSIGGVSRYHIELFNHFSNDIEAILPSIFSDNIYLKELKKKHFSLFPENQSPYKKNIYKVLNILQSRFNLLTTNYDIFHPTFFNPYFINHSHKPVVVTMHDLNHWKFPTMTVKAKIVQDKECKICNYVNHIIAISEETKKDLIEYLNIPENKITVIYHGVDQTLIKKPLHPLIDEPYILYIGGRSGYKNFTNFLKAYSMIDKNIHLICTGIPFNIKEQEEINKLGIKNRIHQYFATDQELNNLLCYAIAFIYPSLGEGFGLPILEAYRCGCPCVISDIECFHEVADKAAIYFNPYHPDDIANSITKIVYNSELSLDLKQRGYDRMKLFTWKKSANQTECLYKSML